MLTMAACAEVGPPDGSYRVTWSLFGDCPDGDSFDLLDVDGATLSWSTSNPNAPIGFHVDVTGTVNGDCIDLPATASERAWSLCSDGADRATGHRERIDGTCAADITATR